MGIRKLIILCLLAFLLSGCDTYKPSRGYERSGQTENDSTICRYYMESIDIKTPRDNGGSEQMDNSEVSEKNREISLRLAEEVGFNWDSTVRVLDEEIGRQTRDARILASALGRAGVRGVIRAELPERERGKAWYMEVESEDNRIYIIGVTLPDPIFDNSSCFLSVVTIRDAETGELIYSEED